ncbi:MAG TPA: M20/M25/M40 family metallo-hydrolase [Thermoanaerobaculia bacterium]|nr:M20/M25/M40 family metallo-hydrolase [Thermoanaerobaculia bacterium]
MTRIPRRPLSGRRAHATRAFLLLTLFLVAPFHCRKADGASRDPGEREAEEAFVAYLRIDTSNPPGNESAGARFLQQLLTKNGIESKLVGSDPARQGLYARLKANPPSAEKALILMHHIDVVPATASQWTKPPFSGTRSGGYIWGRGALDVKSLGIAELMAMLDLKRRGVALRRDVIFLAVPDEETGGAHGAEMLLRENPELFENAGFVLNEGGSNETIVDFVSFWGIEVQQKVPLWLRVNVDGVGGHAASPPDGGGTVAKLVRALAKIEQLETPYRMSPPVANALAVAARVRKDPRGAMLRTLKLPLDPRLEAELPQGYRNLLRDTITITHVSAGNSVNVIPAAATADVDIRLLPDSSSDEMLKRVQDAVGKDAKIEVLVKGTPVPETSSDTELFRVMSNAMRAAEPKSAVGPMISLGTTDSRYFRARGIAAYGIAPFKVNYYDADSVHGVDERMRARFFAEGVRLMRRIVNDFCVRK